MIVRRALKASKCMKCPMNVTAILPRYTLARDLCTNGPLWSMFYARFTLADPTPRLCPDAVGSANVNGFLTRNRLSGPRREVVGRSGAERVQCNCLSEGVVINTTSSPYAHRTNRRKCTRWAPFGQCEWGPQRDVGRFCPNLRPTTLEANRGVGSGNVKRALAGKAHLVCWSRGMILA